MTFLIGCGGEKSRPVGISLTDATLAADGLARHAHSPAEYKRACSTRLRDGFVLTYRFVPPSNGRTEAILGVPSFVRIVVPDSGPGVERQLLARTANAPFVRDAGAQAPHDSAATIVAAQRALTEPGTVHCLLPLIGGAWVEFLSTRDSSVADARGTVVAVNGNGAARVIATF